GQPLKLTGMAQLDATAPDKQAAKKIHRRRLWRVIRRGLFAILVVLLVTRSSVSPERQFASAVRRQTAGHLFDLSSWEFRAIGDEVRRWFGPPPLPGEAATRKRVVLDFLARADQIRAIQRELDSLAAQGRQDEALEQQLAALLEKQEGEAPLVEQILARQISRVLQEEELDWRGRIFPPLSFRLENLPTLLVISPRDNISQRYTHLLQPGLTPAARTGLEDAIDRDLKVSSLIVDIGGFGTYPSLVIGQASLPALVDIIAHEWTHAYLVFRPLGWNYYESPQMVTINETVASIVGTEVSAKVMARYYPEFAPAGDPFDESAEPLPPPEPSPFHLAMRRIRLRVDELLAEGKVEEAERFMEAERRALVAGGHSLRKLNQAYFAFHGAYATSPASVDPIGPQLRALRAQSGSLRAFLDRVGSISSYDAWLEIAPSGGS
ncbi:MAG: hypothetical protein ACE5H9_21260, partial [Anaerolineae bacterium]